jgi:hypothetical protein
MYRLSAAIITALFFIAPTKSHSQITPVWFTLLTPAQQSLTTTVSLPAGPTYRIGDSENDKWSAPGTTRPKQRINFRESLYYQLHPQSIFNPLGISLTH